MVAIVPAVAGPFDLGTVVVAHRRSTWNPNTARVRAVSDPLPHDRRRRPGSTCARSRCSAEPPELHPQPDLLRREVLRRPRRSRPLGSERAALERFQVGGCKSLPYKPKLSARLFGPIHRGGHPRLKAVLSAKPGEANTAARSPSPCRARSSSTRPTSARSAPACSSPPKPCPAGSVYGHVKANTPLLDYPLKGPIYLRSSSTSCPTPSPPCTARPPSRSRSTPSPASTRSRAACAAAWKPSPTRRSKRSIVTLQGGAKGLFPKLDQRSARAPTAPTPPSRAKTARSTTPPPSCRPSAPRAARQEQRPRRTA